jgi:hypothetical protein
MKLHKYCGILLLSFLASTNYSDSRNPFEFAHKTIKHDVQQNSVQGTPPPDKWIIKERNGKLILLENCEDGQLRAIEIPQLEQQ